jgi:hypothetical protein
MTAPPLRRRRRAGTGAPKRKGQMMLAPPIY